MSLFVAALAAAGAVAVSGALLARGWLRRRAEARAAERPVVGALARASAPGKPGAAGPRPSRRPPARRAELDRSGAVGDLGLGDVVQVEDETRWLGSGLHLRDGRSVRCALWFGATEGDERVVVSFPLPERHLYWLARADSTLRAEPPSQLDLGALSLDRCLSFPVEIEALRCKPPDLGLSAAAALYQSPSGVAALVLTGTRLTLVYVGRRIEAGDYIRLGNAGPTEP